MCDYSLHAQPNRLAREGEELIVNVFPGGSRGFAPRADFEEQFTCQSVKQSEKPWWTWDGIVAYWKTCRTAQPRKPLMAVCIPPGAALRLNDIPANLQREFRVGESEEVVFTQLGYEAYTYRDAVRFSNGKEMGVQRLSPRQRAVVLSLGPGAAQELIEIPAEYVS